MKDTFTKTNLKNFNNAFLILGLMAAFFVAIFNFLLYDYAGYNPNKCEKIDVTISSVFLLDEKDEDNKTICLDVGFDTYRVPDVIAGQFKFEDFKKLENQEATIYLYKNRFYSLTFAVGIETDEFNLDFNKSIELLKNEFFWVTFGIGLFYIFILLVALFIYLYSKKAPKEKEEDLLILLSGRSTTSMSQARKKYLIGISIFGLLWLLMFIPLIIVGLKDEESVLFYALFGSWLGLVVLFCVFALASLPFLRKRDIEFYDQLLDKMEKEVRYKFETNEDFFDYYNWINLKFTQEGLEYKKENNEEILFDLYQAMDDEENLCNDDYSIFLLDKTFKYKDLNFYTKVLFKPAYDVMRIFIVSNLKDEDAQGLEHNFAFELSADLLYAIKKYNLEVKGLDYVLKNRKNLMENNSKGKIKVVCFKDDEQSEI